MITKATLQDISELEMLVNSAYRGESSKKGWTTEANLLEGIRIDTNELSEIIEDSKSSIFKYQENNQILGCVLLVEKTNKLYLGMLCVNPELQNSGIGKKILQFANDYAIDKGLPRIIMTVISERIELISWYNRHGYFDSGEREPFPDNHEQDIISGDSLEFIVLEKIV
jgi:ribosomal protein S18 acetylase RimI-like enzyme